MKVLVGYKKCTTCQKAEKFLQVQGVAYTYREIDKQNPAADELREWYTRSGLPLKRFFNTSGLLYKKLELKDKLAGMPEEEQLALLATDGMLVKRPILLLGTKVMVGFQEEKWREELE